MKRWAGAGLAVLALSVGGWAGGWQGLVLAFSVTVFWLLLQFSRALRALKSAGNAPVGHVESAVMLHARLQPGLTMAQLLGLTRSLGRQVAEQPPTWAWTDAGGVRVEVVFDADGRCRQGSLHRPQAGAAPIDSVRPS